MQGRTGKLPDVRQAAGGGDENGFPLPEQGVQRFVTFVTFLKTGASIQQMRRFVKLLETFLLELLDRNPQNREENGEKSAGSTKSSYNKGYKSYNPASKSYPPGAWTAGQIRACCARFWPCRTAAVPGGFV